MGGSIKVSSISVFETYINEVVSVANQGESELNSVDSDARSLIDEIESKINEINAKINTVQAELTYLLNSPPSSADDEDGSQNAAYQAKIDMLMQRIHAFEAERQRYEELSVRLNAAYSRFSASKNFYSECASALKCEIPNMNERLRILRTEVELSSQ